MKAQKQAWMQVSFLQGKRVPKLTIVSLKTASWRYPEERRRSDRKTVEQQAYGVSWPQEREKRQRDEDRTTTVQMKRGKTCGTEEPKGLARLQVLAGQADVASEKEGVGSHKLLTSTIQVKVELQRNDAVEGLPAKAVEALSQPIMQKAQGIGRNPFRTKCRFGCDDKLFGLKGECECGAFRGTEAEKDPVQVRNLNPPEPGGKVVWMKVRDSAVRRSQVYTADMQPVWWFYRLECPDCPSRVPLFSTDKARCCEHLRTIEVNKGSAMIYSGVATDHHEVQVHVHHILGEMHTGVGYGPHVALGYVAGP